MARLIIDDIVRKNMLKRAGMRELYNSVMGDPKFQGTVVDTEKKVDFSKASELGLQYCSMFKSLSEKFQMFKEPMENPVLVLSKEDGSEIKVNVTADQLSMVKALVVEQINPCSAYSRVVAELFWDYVLILAKGRSAKDLEFIDANKSWDLKVKENLKNYMVSQGV